MDLDFEIYEGKKYTDLIRDIVKNHKAKQTRIKALTDQLAEMVTEPGEAVAIVPLIRDYLDADIRNDDSLVKLAQIMQKAATPTAAESGFSNSDLESLFSDLQTSVDPTVNVPLKQLPSTS